MLRLAITINPPSDDDYKFRALTDIRTGSLVSPNNEDPDTIPTYGGRKILIGQHEKTERIPIFVRWDRVTAAYPILPGIVGMPYKHMERISPLNLTQCQIRAGTKNEHRFYTIPEGAKTMIALENGGTLICTSTDLAKLLTRKASWTPSQKGVHGLLLRAAKDATRQITTHPSVTRDGLRYYWGNWRGLSYR